MRQALAKATRRDLRRAVGEETLSLVEANSHALDQQVLPNLQALTKQLHEVDTRVRGLDHHLTPRLLALERRMAWHQALTFVGRLRWLFRGR